MAVFELAPEFAENLRTRPTFRSWREAEEYLNVVGWPRDRYDWPEWTHPHLTDAMVDTELSLPFRIIYSVLVERSGLPMPCRAVLHYLARLTNGAGRRAWPPLNTIGDRVGATRRTVQRAIQQAEESGWLLVVRHVRAPSDYLLDVPDYLACPCLDCTREGVTESPQGVRDAPPGCQEVTTGVSESHTHLVQSLGSAPDQEHTRVSSDDATPGTVSDPPITSRHGSGVTLANAVRDGRVSEEQVHLLLERFSDVERSQFMAGYREVMEAVPHAS